MRETSLKLSLLHEVVISASGQCAIWPKIEIEAVKEAKTTIKSCKRRLFLFPGVWNPKRLFAGVARGRRDVVPVSGTLRQLHLFRKRFLFYRMAETLPGQGKFWVTDRCVAILSCFSDQNSSLRAHSPYHRQRIFSL